jgi:serine protease Do
MKKIIQAIIIISVASLSGYVGARVALRDQSRVPTTVYNTKELQTTISNEGDVINLVAESVGQSVVSIKVQISSATTDFFGFTDPYTSEGAGTGVIISADGIIVTNRHVVPRGAKVLSVVLSDGTEITDIAILGQTNDGDPLDIAFIKINDAKGKTLVPAKLGLQTDTSIGEKVLAIGNALGEFQNTVTAGIISGFGRNIIASSGDGGASESLQNLIQTDAAINQGNSGGPLVNLAGEVIGINVAVAGGDAQNIGFAIPVNDIEGLVKSVIEKGKIERPYLGVRYVMLDQSIAYEYNLKRNEGAYVPSSRGGSSSILNDGPASKAGLKEQDIITKIDDIELKGSISLSSALSKKSVGDTVTLYVDRNGEEIKLQAKLQIAP